MNLNLVRRGRTAVALLLLTACEETNAPVRVASVEISPAASTLLFGPGGGQTVQLSATARSLSGGVLTSKRIDWSVQGLGVASVSATGLVTALGVGTVTVRASADDQAATLTITVLPVPVADIAITTPAQSLTRSPLVVGSVQLAAVAYDSTGAALPNRPLVWNSKNVLVATVNSTGQVRAEGGGSTHIVVSANGLRDSVSVSVTADENLPAGFDIAIADARWTQASQTPDGSIPLLLGSRDAVLNITTSSPAALAVPGRFELRLAGADGSPRWSARQSAPIPAGTTTAALPTVQFLIPSEELALDLQWEILWDPDNELPDADASTDRFPRGGRAALSVVAPPTLKLRFVPVSLTAHGGSTGNVSTTNVEEYLRLIREFGPVGRIEYTIAPAFPSDVAFGVAPNGGGSTFWVSLLQQLDAERVASVSFADAHWVGVVAPPPGFTFASFGGFGFIPNSGTSFGPGTRTFAVVNAFWFTRESQTRELMMHELGHNLGRRHAPCGGASGTDPSFPDPAGRVGPGGHDTYAFERQSASSANAIPNDRGDTMGYCTPVWISTYSYDAMLRFRGSAVVASVAPAAPQQALLVYGLADDAGNATMLRARTSSTSAEFAPDAGNWEALVFDEAATVIARRRFALGQLDHLDSQRPISVAIPLSGVDAARVTRVELRAPTGLRTEIVVQSVTPP